MQVNGAELFVCCIEHPSHRGQQIVLPGFISPKGKTVSSTAGLSSTLEPILIVFPAIGVPCSAHVLGQLLPHLLL